jgi:stearoyl-CoA desaturase (delta-9 desaturase)
MQEPEHEIAGDYELVDRVATGVVTAVPFAIVGLAIWQTWDSALRWSDLIVFFATYLPIALGVTVGYHRLLTHRSFKTGPVLRAILAILGSAAIEGPVIEWVANHRKHHAYADKDGDPHSPHVDHGGGWRGALRGLAHAHVGWLFRSPFANQRRYAPDLLADPVLRFVDRYFLLWSFLGLAFPFGLGVALTGTVSGGLTGLLWGGGVRVFVLHHVTFSINSVCHFFGGRRFRTDDESRNVAWLSLASLGESWHHNHHAFPTSAAHGLRRREPDPSAAVIHLLERLGLAWDVVRVPPHRITERLAPVPPAAQVAIEPPASGGP